LAGGLEDKSYDYTKYHTMDEVRLSCTCCCWFIDWFIYWPKKSLHSDFSLDESDGKGKPRRCVQHDVWTNLREEEYYIIKGTICIVE